MSRLNTKQQAISLFLWTKLQTTPLAYMMDIMEFIETPVFTRLLMDLLSDDEYAGLQNLLVDNPERGDIIKGGGGIRKIRYAIEGKGKSGWAAPFIIG